MSDATTEARPILAAVTDMVEAFVLANAFPPVMLKVTAGQLQQLREELPGSGVHFDSKPSPLPTVFASVPDAVTLYLPTGPMVVEREA